MTKQYQNTEPSYDPREDDFASALEPLPEFVAPRDVSTLADVQANLQRSWKLMHQQGFTALPRAYDPPAPRVSVLRDKPMSQAKRLALVLLEQEVLEFEDDTRPDYCDGPEVHAAWRTKVRTQMAHRIRELLHRVSVARTKTVIDPEGNTVKVTKRYGMRTALVKLRAMRFHPAFQRTQACAEHWTYKTRTCDCATDTQRRLRKSIAVMTKHDRPWVLLLVYLTYQGYVQHFYDFTPPVAGGTEEGHENQDPRVWKGEHRENEQVTRWRTETDEDGNEQDVVDSVDSVTVVDGGKTRFLDTFDLRGWDRPSSYPTKTTRMAFCTGVCLDMGQPWFRVPLKRVQGRYERPEGEIVTCPTCGADEGTPERKTTPITYTAQQKYVRKGQLVVREEVFERRNGRWFYSSTGERCAVMLGNEIERRWRKQAPAHRPRVFKSVPQPKVTEPDHSLHFTLAERVAWYRQQDAEATAVQAPHLAPTRVPQQTGKLLAGRTENIKPWAPTARLQSEIAAWNTPRPIPTVPPVEEEAPKVLPTPLPEGEYKLRIEKGYLVETTGTGHEVHYHLTDFEQGELCYGDHGEVMWGPEALLQIVRRMDQQ